MQGDGYYAMIIFNGIVNQNVDWNALTRHVRRCTGAHYHNSGGDFEGPGGCARLFFGPYVTRRTATYISDSCDGTNYHGPVVGSWFRLLDGDYSN